MLLLLRGLLAGTVEEPAMLEKTNDKIVETGLRQFGKRHKEQDLIRFSYVQ